MTLLHDAMTAYLAGLTTNRTEKEIWWENERGDKLTVELVNSRWEKYIVRQYYDNGNLWWEENYLKDKLHGLNKTCYKNGNLVHEINYRKNQRHGLCRWCWENGNPRWKQNYYKGKLHGLCRAYYENGNLKAEYNYNHGKQI